MILNNTLEHENNSADTHRLPCRGCTASCKHYSQCEGKPWRSSQTENTDTTRLKS